jgi:hypothetical protein
MLECFVVVFSEELEDQRNGFKKSFEEASNAKAKMEAELSQCREALRTAKMKITEMEMNQRRGEPSSADLPVNF